MGIDTNNIQINTFVNGMDTDTSDMLIDKDAYRMAENLRYITDVNETTGELRLIEGAQPINIYFANETEHDTAPDGFRILAYNSIRNIGALICTRNKTNNESIDPFAVYRAEYREESGDLYLDRVFGWCEEPINRDIKISTTMKWEDKDQLQLYIADGKHPLMKINLYDQSRSTDFNYISSRPQADLSIPKITEILLGGYLKAGLVQYAYFLYNENNISTNLSPLSSVKSIVGPFVEIGSIGLMKDESSNMGLLVEMLIPDNVYDKYKYIKLFRIHYVENGQLPSISLICDIKYPITTILAPSGDEQKWFVYRDFGNVSLQEFTSEQFNSTLGVTIIPKVIERKNNLLFAANLKYDVDELNSKYLNMDFRAFSTGDDVVPCGYSGDYWPLYDNWPSYDELGNKINTNLDISQEYDVNKWKDPARNIFSPTADHDDNIGGCGINIRWKLSCDIDSSEILNKTSYDDNTQEINLKLVKSVNRYNNIDEKYLAHDEIYRYGIILYSKNGTKYPVKWICDIRTPNIGAKNLNDLKYGAIHSEPMNGNIYPIRLYALFLVKPNVLDAEEISGFEIVRVNRTINDSATITQGIVASTAVSIKDASCTETMPNPSYFDRYIDTNKRCSTGFPFLDFTEYVSAWDEGGGIYAFKRYAITKIDILQFYSPEITYNPDEIFSIVKNIKNLHLQATSIVFPIPPSKQDTTVFESSSDGTDGLPLVNYDGYKYSMILNTGGYMGSAKNANNNYFSYTPFLRIYPYEERSIPENNYRFKKHICYGKFAAKRQFTRWNGREIPDTDMISAYQGYNLYKLRIDTIPDLKEDEYATPYTPIYSVDIKDVEKIKSTKYNEFISNNSFGGFDNLSYIDGCTFYNNVIPFIMSNVDNDWSLNKLSYGQSYNAYNGSLVATCDPSLILKLDEQLLYPEDVNTISVFDYYYSPYIRNRGDFYSIDTNLNQIQGTVKNHEWSLLCNIRKKNLIPYNGFDLYSRNTSTYVSKGNYFSLTEYSSAGWNAMYDGDTKVTMFEFVSAHKWYDATHWSPRCSIICQVPVESRMDLQLDSGEKFSNNKNEASLVLVEPCNFNELYVQERQSYMYNTVYSADANLILNTGQDTSRQKIESYDCRVHYSNPGEPLQSIDPWLVFLPLNYLDVDSQYGPITNLRTFKNKLIFWLKDAVGVLSVKERVLIADQSNLPLILGTGGVLDRYDYLTTSNGMKENQHADAQSEQALYWWDGVNNTICSYVGGNGIVQLSKAKKVLNLLNKWRKDDNIIETDLQVASWPIIIYDKKYNEVLFKVGGRSVNDNFDHPVSLVYNEQQQQFSSVYTIDPSCYLQFGAQLILLQQPAQSGVEICAYAWNQSQTEDDNGISVGFDDEDLYPYIKFVINRNKEYTKVYDNMEFAGTIPGCFDDEEETLSSDIKFRFNTPLKLMSMTDGESITNRQYDFKFAIPRSGEYQMIHGDRVWVTREYGDRLRGKTMQCEMSSTSNSLDFSLQYFITKYRMSWS